MRTIARAGELEMGEDLLNDGRVIDRGDELHPPGAARTAQDIQIEGRHVILHLLPVMRRDRLEPQ